MNYLFTISVRNLIRQKRRNILLGAAIAFGTMILVLANAFSHGISEVLFDRVVSYVAGHVSVSFGEDGNLYKQVFHDGERIDSIIAQTVPQMEHSDEAVGIVARVLGIGAGDNCIMVGMDIDAGKKMNKKDAEDLARQTEDNFRMIEGSFEALKSAAVTNPVLISEQKAKTLNVKTGDVLRARFLNVYGQNQAAQLQVVGVFRPANIFMNSPIFLNIHDLKHLGGYGPHDIAQVNITIKNPQRDAARLADSLHARLQPALAVIEGEFSANGHMREAAAFGFGTDSASLAVLRKTMTIADSDTARAFDERAVLVSTALATSLNLRGGDTVAVTYRDKHEHEAVTLSLPVTALFSPPEEFNDAPMVLVGDKRFYAGYYDRWPVPPTGKNGVVIPQKSSALYAALVPEWHLLERSRTTQEMQKKIREVSQEKRNGAVVDVRSMYESASAVLQIENVLNLITFSAVMVLFFIIQVGVVNTLRMTIRERTREIGTVRAIGMQQGDVRNAFILETLLLTLAAALAGTLCAFGAMAMLSLPTLNTENPMGMLLVNGHLFFAPTILGVGGYIVLILGIAVATAWFPARKAAKMSAAAALRHFE